MYEKELQNLGLSEKESKVYLTALELGAETAQNIAKRANINRATTYVQIDLLKQKGLMSEFEKGKKTYYVAETPERLSGLLNVFEKELDLKKVEVGRVLPGLLEMFAGMGERPKVRFFEGVEGVKAMDEELLVMKEKLVYVFIDLDSLSQYNPHQSDVTRQRIDKKIQTRAIYTSKSGPLLNASSVKEFREAKFVDYEKMPLRAEIDIYDNKINIVTYKVKPVGVIIENFEMAETVKAIFKLLWNIL